MDPEGDDGWDVGAVGVVAVNSDAVVVDIVDAVVAAEDEAGS